MISISRCLKVVIFPLFLTLILAPFLFAQGSEPAKKSLFERLGGTEGIKGVVDDFVNRAASDPAVNFTREGTDKKWDAAPENVTLLKTRLTQFISVATGNPDGVYEGKDMKTAHEGMKITNAQFDALAADLKASMEKLGVPAVEQQELLDIVGTTRGQIVEE